MRLFENRVLRKILGHERGEVTGECSRLHNEELNNLYSFLNIMGHKIRHVARTGRRCRDGAELCVVLTSKSSIERSTRQL
jgi:hypothetical protein